MSVLIDGYPSELKVMGSDGSHAYIHLPLIQSERKQTKITFAYKNVKSRIELELPLIEVPTFDLVQNPF
jgi:hypothetical protein